MASRVQTAVTMRQVTGSMMNVVKGMDQAMKAMDLEKVCLLSLIPPDSHITKHANKWLMDGYADLASDGQI